MKTRIKIVVTDVDGTLTENPDTYKISIEAISIIRSLELNGIKTILASGNTIPMIIGLARYIGASGGVVGENGGAIFYRDRVEWLCNDQISQELEYIEKILSKEFENYIVRSWQNDFMRCSKAFRSRDREDHKKIIVEIKDLLRKKGFDNYHISSSRVAIHINPLGSLKSDAVEKILRYHDVSWEEVLAIGDSENDIDMIMRAGLGCLVKNAPDDLKRGISCVSEKDAGEGFSEIIRRYIGI